MKVFNYEDIQLTPNRCTVNSRSECDTTVILGKRTFKMPVVLASTRMITDETIAEFLTGDGYSYIMHRFDKAARVPFIKKMKKRGLVTPISIGAREEEYSSIEKLAKESLNPDYITIDIAHGHTNSVIGMIQHIKKYLPRTFVITGNVGISEAAYELENAGADATKVGTGLGKVCTTRIKTDFETGGWQLAALRWRTKAAHKPIIADDGIRTYGDIMKSVRFGVTMIMIGSLFASHEESPGETKVENEIVHKEYSGSALELREGERRNAEGKKIWIQHRGSLRDTLVEIQQGLQSSISHAGGKDLEAIQKVNYIIVGNSIFNGDTI